MESSFKLSDGGQNRTSFLTEADQFFVFSFVLVYFLFLCPLNQKYSEHCSYKQFELLMVILLNLNLRPRANIESKSRRVH